MVVALAERVHHAPLLRGQLLRLEVERELVELAGEPERRVVAILDLRNACPRIHPNIERLVPLENEGDGVLDVLLVRLLAVDNERAGAALAEAPAVELEVEHQRVLAGLELGTRPNLALEIEQVVQEDGLAPADA